MARPSWRCSRIRWPITKAQQRRWRKIAVILHLSDLTGGCDLAQKGNAQCAEAFLQAFAPRAFRRPLTPTEQQRLRAVFQAELDAGSDFSRAIATLLEVILQSPQFLYREELGPVDAPAGSTVHLTDYEVASSCPSC